MTSTTSESTPAERPEPAAGRTFETIGVIGLGTMGAGIAEVFARNGFSVIGVEQNEAGVQRGREHLEHSTGRAVARGKITEAEQQAILDHITFSTDLKALAHADLVVEAVIESLEIKKDLFRRLDEVVRPDAILATNTSSLSVTEIGTANARPGPGHRRALLQPGAGPEPRRDRPHRRDRAERARRRGDPRRPPRQEPRHLRRQGRVHRQHAALRLPQPRGGDVRGQVRLPRGHRRGHAVRLRLPHGSAGAARPDRPRHGVRDPRHDVQAGPRPAARARADPQADGDRGPARPEVGPRASTPTPGPTAIRWCPDFRTPKDSDKAAAAPRHPDRRRRRHRHDGQRHRRGVRQGRLRRAVRRPHRRQGRRRARHDRALARQGDPARQAARGGEGRHPRRTSPAARRSTTWPASTSSSRRSPRTST